MLDHIAEYIGSLEKLAGMRWKNSEPAVSVLTRNDRQVIEIVRSGRAGNDLELARSIFGKGATVDGRYRKRVAALARRLSAILLTCPISRGIDQRKNDSISCVRHLATGESLIRSNAPKSAHAELIEALSKMVYPELCWYAPPVYLALAYNHAVNGRGPSARRDITLARAATAEAMLVSTILELWVHLSIPIHRSADRTKQQPILAEAREVLTRVARKPLTSVVAMAGDSA